jgi:hypothetical protein
MEWFRIGVILVVLGKPQGHRDPEKARRPESRKMSDEVYD